MVLVRVTAICGDEDFEHPTLLIHLAERRPQISFNAMQMLSNAFYT